MRNLGRPPRNHLVQKAEEQGAQGRGFGIVHRIGGRVAVRRRGGLEGFSGRLHRHALLSANAWPWTRAR
jgi:hypothetical protein